MVDILHQYAVELFSIVGSLLGLRYVEDLSRSSAAASLVSGISCAYFGTPLVVYFVQPPQRVESSVAGLAGLLLGFTGFALLAALAKLVRKSGDAASESVPDMIRRWTGKAGGKE
jgi:hypothetical protein